MRFRAPYVERLADLGVTDGCATEPARFCPYETVTRARMASFLVRAFGLPVAPSAGFADVEGGVHAANIDALAASGVTSGCRTEPLRYCPSRATTRAQMATFLVRALADTAVVAGSVFGAGDTIGGFPSGLGATSGTFTNASVTVTGGGEGVRLEMSEGGTVVYTDVVYTCVSAGGCTIDNGRVIGGTVTAATPTTPPVTTTTSPADTAQPAAALGGGFTAVAAGDDHSCALRTNSTVLCWGGNRDGQTTAPGGTFAAAAAGGNHSCAIRTNSTVVCWGRNYDGQATAPGGTFAAVAAGDVIIRVRLRTEQHGGVLG